MIWKAIKGLGKGIGTIGGVGLLGGMSYVGIYEASKRYGTLTPAQNHKAVTDRVQSILSKEGYTSATQAKHVEIGSGIHAFHSKAEKPGSYINSYLFGAKPASTSVRGISFFDTLAIHAINTENDTTVVLKNNKDQELLSLNVHKPGFRSGK